MTPDELDKWLKSANVPAHSPEYWSAFPDRVNAGLRRTSSPTPMPARRGAPMLAAWGLGFATACVIIAMTLGIWRKKVEANSSAAQLEMAQKYYAELRGLFPNQIRAIVFEQQGPRLILADCANVPSSPALYLKICGNDKCERVITFSGQEVQLEGQRFEVLADAKGKVMLVGNERVWTGENPSDPIRVQARTLAGSL